MMTVEDRATATYLWCIAGASAMLHLCLAWTITDYAYPHAWVSAHYAVMAQAFNEHGLLNLGAVPVQNLGPLTAQPDAYWNWPAGYPILLSIVFDLFGNSPRVQHLTVAIMLVLASLAIAACFWRASARWLPPLTVAVVLGTPLVTAFGIVGLLHVPALLCVCIALFLFCHSVTSRRWPYPALLACGLVLVLAVWFSWEAALVGPALLITAVLLKDRFSIRAALALTFVSVLAAASVLVVYICEYPGLVDSLVQRVLLRAGFAPATAPPLEQVQSPHLIQELVVTGPRSLTLGASLSEHARRLPLLGPVSLTMLFLAAILMPRFIRSARQFDIQSIPIRSAPIRTYAYPLCGLLGMFIGWAILMRQHVFVHSYTTLSLAPAAGAAAGFVAVAIDSKLFSAGRAITMVRRNISAIALSIASLAMAVQIASIIYRAEHFTNDLDRTIKQQASFIRASTPADALVMTPESSMVFVWYSQRHTIRSVKLEQHFKQYLPMVMSLCPTCPVYYFVPAEMTHPTFTDGVAIAATGREGTLYQLR